MKVEVYRSMDVDIPVDQFDISKAGADFGFHFGTKQSALHRSKSKDKAYLKKYILDISKPIKLFDSGIWSLRGILKQLIQKGVATKEEEKTLLSLSLKKLEKKERGLLWSRIYY